ncbi:hypothetical protein PLICRDRAFT_178778 [Plicaturopsis crispa FD-325 SS-3]|uniref:Uncharacterized protein n=1 Tax=Plicaturopsis crispa FD-325 SS-3 TaxID=944288 RepID=A0A0C9T9R5_PLICR|nr:hypothetical protein PLICRDRAFT_178778 [Plicaturopsis crispa FD-325 SS-3]
MSPQRKPLRAIKVKVPRHNAQRVGAKLEAEVQVAARAEGVRVDIAQPGSEQSNSLLLAIESASEWNSLLMTARAERGPQWDIGTQQFLVDEGSDLYYDPSPLDQSQKSEEEDREGSARGASQSSRRADRQLPPQAHRSSSTPYGYQSPSMAPRYLGGTTAPFNAVPPGQFYGSEAGTPGRGGMHPDSMSVSPDVRRRVTRGMADDSYYGN